MHTRVHAHPASFPRMDGILHDNVQLIIILALHKYIILILELLTLDLVCMQKKLL